jgi:cellulose biosynthesis protein BcsQ
MTAPIIAFLGSRSGVGTTTLVHHLAWMYADLGLHVTVADADPQVDLTTALLPDGESEGAWLAPPSSQTIYSYLRAVMGGHGVSTPYLLITEGLKLLPGDPRLPLLAEETTGVRGTRLGASSRAGFAAALDGLLRGLALEEGTDLVLLDVSLYPAPVGRAVTASADCLVLAACPSRLSVWGLRVLGEILTRWRERDGRRSTARNGRPRCDRRGAQPIGYVVSPVRGLQGRYSPGDTHYSRELASAYLECVPGEANTEKAMPGEDPHCIATLRRYDTLLAMAKEAGKPLFGLKPVDGALGAHAQAVKSAYQDFHFLAIEIAKRAGVDLP